MLHSGKYITFNYESYGTGKPMLILHGNGPDLRMMTGCLEPLFTEEDHIRRIYVDLPGMGRTPAAEWMDSSDAVLRAVELMIEALIPGEPFLLAGQSYGGYLARGLQRNYSGKIDGMFLLCPCIIAEMKERTLPEHEVLYVEENWDAGLQGNDREEFASMAVVQTRSVWERFEFEVLSGLKLADEAFMRNIKDNGTYAFSFDPDAVPALDKPVLIVTGRQDSLTGYRDALNLVERYPHATFSVLDRAGHNLHLEQESLTGALVREWLSRVAD